MCIFYVCFVCLFVLCVVYAFSNLISLRVILSIVPKWCCDQHTRFSIASAVVLLAVVYQGFCIPQAYTHHMFCTITLSCLSLQAMYGLTIPL